MPKKVQAPTTWYTIPEAAAKLNLTEAYIRLMVRQEVIQTRPEPIKEGSRVTRHMISEQELELFATRDGKKAPRRKDGRKKHCLYALPEEMLRIKELLYSTHDAGLAIVAQSIDGGIEDEEYYVPPSKLGPSQQ
jgi:hypothetical protein